MEDTPIIHTRIEETKKEVLAKRGQEILAKLDKGESITEEEREELKKIISELSK